MPSSVCKNSDVCSRSEEHTSELQSHDNLVWRLLLEKKGGRAGAGRRRGRRAERGACGGRGQHATPSPGHRSPLYPPSTAAALPELSFFFFLVAAPPQDPPPFPHPSPPRP